MRIRILMTDPDPSMTKDNDTFVQVTEGDIYPSSAERLRWAIGILFRQYLSGIELEAIQTPEAAREFLQQGSLETCTAAILKGALALQREAERKTLSLKVSRHLMHPQVAVELGAAIDDTTKEVVWPDGERYPIIAPSPDDKGDATG